MNRYRFKDGRQLRCGYTTGTCAAAAAKAAAELLLCGASSEYSETALRDVAIFLPDGTEVKIPIEDVKIEYAEDGIFSESEKQEALYKGRHFLQSCKKTACRERAVPFIASVTCSVRKDAGDDADVTDGLLICACVRMNTDTAECDKNLRESRLRKGEVSDIRDGKLGVERGTAPSGELPEGMRRRSGDVGDIVQIEGGIGVGRVTKPGLDQAVGEAAINTVPRRMITDAVLEVCERVGFEGRLIVEISVPEGAETAGKTFNPMLGIEGGISILGTSGIVEPMSDAAIVETIRTEIRVKSAEIRCANARNAERKETELNCPQRTVQQKAEVSCRESTAQQERELNCQKCGIQRAASREDEIVRQVAESGVFLAAVPGNYGMKFACDRLKLKDENIVKCSNFIGETLDAACEFGLSGILLIGNAGKLIKLAAGIMNTHSSQADGRLETVIACSLEAGASLGLLKRISGCVTTEAAFSVLKEEGLAQQVLDIAAERAGKYAARRVRSSIKTGVVLFSSEADLVSYGGEAGEILDDLVSRSYG